MPTDAVHVSIACADTGFHGRGEGPSALHSEETMTIIDNSRLPRAEIPGIAHVTLAGSANGLHALSVWRQSIAPGGATPPHRHDCEEVVLVERGRGELRLGGSTQPFGPDNTLVIPRNADHQIVNTGDEPLQVIGIFATAPVEVFLPDGTSLALPWPS
jgi:mannose-6-phosphate isomerase-like protein (cupin superfamily)